MAILLGVDTGGTYTDAVLLEDEERVLATAKALTTRHDLAVGIGQAIHAVLDKSGIDPAEIALASLSTTLATNALVEDQGGRVALIAIGFDPADLKRQGLEESLRGDPIFLIRGGHGHSGERLAELDVAARNRAGTGPLRGDRIEPGHEELERRVNGAGLGREKAPAAAVRRGEEQLRPGKPYPVEHGDAVFLLDAEDVAAPLIGVGRTQRCDQHECDCHDQRQPSNCTVHHALSAPVPL